MTSVMTSRVAAASGVALCAVLGPIVAHAAVMGDATDEPGWVRSLAGLHQWAAGVTGDVYRYFGAASSVIYALLLAGLWLAGVHGTRFLRVVLTVAGVADLLAYLLPSGPNVVPGVIEFFCLPLLLVGVGLAAWAHRRTVVWATLVALCIPLAFGTAAALGNWPHGPLFAVAIACCLLVWAPDVPATRQAVADRPRRPASRPAAETG